jgi:hypothetical protein
MGVLTSISDEKTKAATLEFHNLAPCAVKLMWVDYEGQEKCYSTLETEEYYCQGIAELRSHEIRHSAL